MLCLDVRGAVREANQGFILLFASDTQQRPAVPPSPNGFLVASPAPLPLYLAPGWPGCWVALVPVPKSGDTQCSPKQCGSPCSCQGHPKGSFTRQQHGPGSSPHRGVLPLWWREGRDPWPDISQPKTSTCRHFGWRNSVRAFIQKGLQNTSVCTGTCVHVHAFQRDHCRG